MTNRLRLSAMILYLFAIISLVVGIVFLYLAFDKQAYMVNAMTAEKISLSDLGIKDAAPGYIDSMQKAQAAADTVRAHRHTIAPSYGDLMSGGKYDPTNPKHLTYAQALNIENYLYLAVLGFGVIQIAMGVGAFMLLVAFALAVTGYAVHKLSAAKQL
jgi:hypothetical protein